MLVEVHTYKLKKKSESSIKDGLFSLIIINEGFISIPKEKLER